MNKMNNKLWTLATAINEWLSQRWVVTTVMVLVVLVVLELALIAAVYSTYMLHNCLAR